MKKALLRNAESRKILRQYFKPQFKATSVKFSTFAGNGRF